MKALRNFIRNRCLPMAVVAGFASAVPVSNRACAAVSSSIKLIALATQSDSVTLWRQEAGGSSPVTRPPSHARLVNHLTISRDGKCLASVSEDNEIALWRTDPLQKSGMLMTHPSPVWAMAFSPDGSPLATTHRDWTTEVWSTKNQARVACFTGRKGLVVDVALSTGGRALTTVSLDATAKLWSVKDQSDLGALEGQASGLSSAALSLDGRRLAVGGADGHVRLWDVELKRTLGTLRGHESPVQHAAFLADRNPLVSVSDTSMAIWRAASSQDADRGLRTRHEEGIGRYCSEICRSD